MFVSESFDTVLPYISAILNRASEHDFVVFDVDDTVLQSRSGWPLPVDDGMTILRQVLQKNIAVHYVTARLDTPESRVQVYRDLASVGIMTPRVTLRPVSANTWYKIGEFKTNARASIAQDTGGQCLITVGDQWTDMVTISPEGRERLVTGLGNQYILLNVERNGWGVKLKEHTY